MRWQISEDQDGRRLIVRLGDLMYWVLPDDAVRFGCALMDSARFMVSAKRGNPERGPREGELRD